MLSCPFPFRGPPPDRDRDVLGQWAYFNAQKWQERLVNPRLWPRELDLCPLGTRSDGSQQQFVTRADVFHIVRHSTTPMSTAKAYVALAVWGSGMSGWSSFRTLRPFNDFKQSERWIGGRLRSAVRVLLSPSGGPVAAYDALHGNRQCAVQGLGPAYGTKVLYFMGYDDTSESSQPLILDQYVSIAINRLCGTEWPSGDWTVEQYADYIDLAHRWAKTWGTEPDVVERVLFAVGKSDPLAISTLR
jgi:hypothetical protein